MIYTKGPSSGNEHAKLKGLSGVGVIDRDCGALCQNGDIHACLSQGEEQDYRPVQTKAAAVSVKSTVA